MLMQSSLRDASTDSSSIYYSGVVTKYETRGHRFPICNGGAKCLSNFSSTYNNCLSSLSCYCVVSGVRCAHYSSAPGTLYGPYSIRLFFTVCYSSFVRPLERCRSRHVVVVVVLPSTRVM